MHDKYTWPRAWPMARLTRALILLLLALLSRAQPPDLVGGDEDLEAALAAHGVPSETKAAVDADPLTTRASITLDHHNEAKRESTFARTLARIYYPLSSRRSRLPASRWKRSPS